MENSSQDIRRYLRQIYCRRYLFVFILMLVSASIVVYSYRLPKRYQAESVVFIENNVINQLVKGLAVTPSIDDQIRVLNFALNSRELVTRVLKQMNSAIFERTTAEQQRYIEGLKNRTRITLKGKELFIVSVVDSDPYFTRDYVNTLVSSYVEENISSNRNETYGANRFFAEQIEQFRQKLNQAEDVIIEFRKKQGIYLSQDENELLSELKKYTGQLEELELTLNALLAKKSSLSRQLQTLPATVDLLRGGGRTANDIESVEKRLAQLLSRYTENYPEVVRTRIQLQSLRAGLDDAGAQPDAEVGLITSNPLYQEMQQKLFDVDAEMSSLQSKRENLRQRIAQRERDLNEIPVNRKQLSALIQERDSIRHTYQELLSRKAQSEVAKQMGISDKAATFRVVDPAILPERPVSPDLVRMILLALLAGIGVAGGVILLLERLDDSITSPQQLETLGVEVLALIPQLDDAGMNERLPRTDLLLYIVTAVYLAALTGLLGYEFLKRMIA